MQEPIKLRRAGQFLHTGKRDYDDGTRVGNNATKKRTMRVFKRRQRRESERFTSEE